MDQPMNHLSRLLLNERPLIVLPGLAAKIGLNEAILLQQLHWKSRADRAEVQDGRRWVRTTVDALQLEFPFWSKSTVERTLKALKDAGYVESRRSRDANLYTVDTSTTRQLDGSAPSTWPPLGHQLDGSGPSDRRTESQQVDGSPSIEEGREEQEELFGTGAVQSAPAVSPEDAVVSEVWAHYISLFGDKLRVKDITPARRRMIVKAWKATDQDVAILKDAISGLKSYRDTHPSGSSDTSLSVIFETGPHSGRNLTDQLEWWSGQAPDGGGQKASVLDAIPAVHRPLVAQHVQNVNRKIRGTAEGQQLEDAEASETWLRENWQLHGKLRDDGTISWEKIA